MKLVMFYKDKLPEIKKLYANHSPDHNWDSHIVKVIENAQAICMANNIPFTKEMFLGCALHDCMEIYNRDKHHELAAKAVYHILPELGIDDVDIELVSHCCRYHRASEKEDISNMLIDIQVVSAADRCRPSTNKADFLEDVVWRAIQYSMTHTEEVEDTEDPVYSGYKWCMDTFRENPDRIYSDLYRNTFAKQLVAQANVAKELTLNEVREWCKREKGIGAEITLS